MRIDYGICTDDELTELYMMNDKCLKSGFTLHYSQMKNNIGSKVSDDFVLIALYKGFIANEIYAGFHELWLEGKNFIEKVGCGDTLSDALQNARKSLPLMLSERKEWEPGKLNDNIQGKC